MPNNKNRNRTKTAHISRDTLSSRFSLHDQLLIQELQQHGCITNG